MKNALIVTMILLTACAKTNTATPTPTKALNSTWTSEADHKIIDLTPYKTGQGFLAIITYMGGACEYEINVTPSDAYTGSVDITQGVGSDCSEMGGVYSYGLLDGNHMMLCQGSTCEEYQ